MDRKWIKNILPKINKPDPTIGFIIGGGRGVFAIKKDSSGKEYCILKEYKIEPKKRSGSKK